MLRPSAVPHVCPNKKRPERFSACAPSNYLIVGYLIGRDGEI